MRKASFGGLLATTMLGSAALAQVAPGVAPDEGDIVVTAQKRSQSLQDVPISIQALTTARIEQLQLRNFGDYVQYLPSVNFTTGSNGLPGNTSVVFRGIATDGGLVASATLPTVGVYLDEQPITSISGSLDIHLYDIARVEALAGPQGTLFGASSEAGTLRIITNKPDPSKFSAAYNLEANHIFGHDTGGTAEAYVNLPLAGGKAALRAVGWYERTPGFIGNALHVRTFPSSGITQNNSALLGTDLNAVDTYGLRAQLGIDLADNWTVTPGIIAQDTRWHGSFRSDDTKVGELKVGHFFPEYGHDGFWQAGATITGKISDFDVTYAGYYLDRHRGDHHDYSDYGFYYDSIAGSGAYIKDNAGHLIDPSQLDIDHAHTTKLSQELRVASPSDKRLRGIAGLFYQRQTQLEENDFLDAGFADALSVPGRPGQVWLTLENRMDRDYAVFGQLDYDVTDKLTITAGGRGYRYDNSLIGFYGVNTTFFGTGVRQCLGRAAGGGPYGVGIAAVPGSPCTNLGVLNGDGTISPKRSTGDGGTWRANATYKFDRDHLVYFTASTGFRPGGINRAGNASAFDADHLTNYEVGTKNSFLDRHLTLNLTAFWEVWNGVQVTYQVPGGSGVAQITNAGGARSRGLEGDFSWRTGGFTLTGAGTYADAVLTTPLYTGSTVPTAPAGTRLPLTPQFKGSLIGRYEAPIGRYAAHAQLAGVYTGPRTDNIVVADNAKYGNLPDYFTLEAAVGADRGNFTFEVYLRNLTDARGQQSRAAECNISYCGPSKFDPVGEVYRVYIQPRTIGVRFGQKF